MNSPLNRHKWEPYLWLLPSLLLIAIFVVFPILIVFKLSFSEISKAGVIGVTKSVAKELGSRNIMVNAVAPGYIMTDMTENLPDEAKKFFLELIPLKRGGKPQDVANVVAFLCGPDSDYVTGQVINVCGGFLM